MKIKKFQQEDLILANAYEKLVKEINSPQVVFCALEGLKDAFEQIQSQPNKEFILVSAYSDFSLCEQSIDHPNVDIPKTFHMYDWNEICSKQDAYLFVKLGPTVNTEDCNTNHRYNIKIYAYTNFTFDDIPPNLKRWFCTNCNVQHDRITWLPFGINEQGDGHQKILSYHKDLEDKRKLLYVNFQNHTVERLRLKTHYSSLPNWYHWASVRPEASLKAEEFYEDLSSHKFVLCPAGNGLDCYRTYESLYLGSLPIVQFNAMSENTRQLGFPSIAVQNLFGITEDVLLDIYQKVDSFDETQINWDAVTWPYWKARILDEVATLK